MNCQVITEVHQITKHKLTLKFQTIDGIGRLHLQCKDCSRSICMKGKLSDYREDQIVYSEHNGEI
jgi:hypothetical protein